MCLPQAYLHAFLPKSSNFFSTTALVGFNSHMYTYFPNSTKLPGSAILHPSSTFPILPVVSVIMVLNRSYFLPLIHQAETSSCIDRFDDSPTADRLVTPSWPWRHRPYLFFLSHKRDVSTCLECPRPQCPYISRPINSNITVKSMKLQANHEDSVSPGNPPSNMDCCDSCGRIEAVRCVMSAAKESPVPQVGRSGWDGLGAERAQAPPPPCAVTIEVQ